MSHHRERPSVDFSNTVDITIGGRHFVVHCDILTSRSSLLNEQRHDTIHLRDVDANIFSAYLECVYMDNLDVPDEESLHLPLNVYILAQRFGDLKAANTAIDYITKNAEEFDESFDVKGVNRIFQETPQDSPLRHFAVDWFTSICSIDDLDDVDQVPPELLRALVRRYEELIRVNGEVILDGNQPSKRERCFYHQHNDDAPHCEQQTEPAADSGPTFYHDLYQV